MKRLLNSRTNVARMVTGLLVAAIALFIMKGLERPFWRFQSVANKHRRAAVAIRDHVPAFLKWGTKVYTLPYLEKYYGQVYYITQFPEQDNHAEFISNLTSALTGYEQ